MSPSCRRPSPATRPCSRRRAPIRFSGSWSVRLTGEGFHVNHVHPAGWISSAFYVALPEAAMGGDAHAGWLSIGEPQPSSASICRRSG